MQNYPPSYFYLEQISQSEAYLIGLSFSISVDDQFNKVIISLMLRKYKKIVLKQFPSSNFPQDLSCFQLIQEQSKSLPDKYVRIKIKFVSIDPVMRVWISGAKSYLPQMKLNEAIPAFAVGVVSETKSKKFKIGQYIVGVLWWTQECIVKENMAFPKIPLLEEQSIMHRYLSIYGPTGLTAYLSLKQQIMPFPKNIHIVISSAAGGVGLSLVQFLKHFGFQNVIGIAGSDFKCKKMEALGCRVCINYRNQNITKKLKQIASEGVDLYYDNVGEQILEQLIPCMKKNGTIILCGATATYNEWKTKSGVKNIEMMIFKRIKMKGILYFWDKQKLLDSFMEMIQIKLDFVDTVIDGIQSCPQVYQDLYSGKYIGKPIVKF